VGKVFYSGVLIKPITFYESPQNYENADITNIVIEYERSTFATVCAIDDNSIEHPLLSESNEKIKEFIEIDNDCKKCRKWN
jgi:hypothetical protein